MSKFRVLILHASGGMGHVKAAEAIANAFAEQFPHLQVENRNVLDFARPAYRFCYEEGYNFISAHLMGLWGWLYRRYNQPQRHDFLLGLTRWGIERRLTAFLREFRPQFVLGTHPMPIRLLLSSRDAEIAAVPTGVVVTDYGCHSFWVDPRTSAYFVATPEVKSCLAGYRILLERIHVTGIPIDLKFSRPVDRTSVLAKLNLKPELPVVVVVGGLVTERYLQALVEGLLQHQPVQFLVVTGRDRRFYRRLQHSRLRSHPALQILPFISNLDEVLGIADVAVTKGGGLTVSECLARGVPIAIPNVIPGQEEDNLDFLIRHGAALHAATAAQLVTGLRQLFADRTALAARHERCRQLSRPNGALAIAGIIANRFTSPHDRTKKTAAGGGRQKIQRTGERRG